MKQYIPVSILIKNFRVLSDRLFEEFPLTSNVIHFGVHLFIESIDSEYVENVIELFAFMNVFSHAAGFVGPGMFWCAFEKGPVGFPNVFRTASWAGHLVHDVRSVQEGCISITRTSVI